MKIVNYFLFTLQDKDSK